jgi:hypothetical protein
VNNLEGVAVACVVVPVKAADLFVSAKEALVYCQLLLLDKQQNNYELYVGSLTCSLKSSVRGVRTGEMNVCLFILVRF